MRPEWFATRGGGVLAFCIGALLNTNAAPGWAIEPGLAVRINGAPTVERAGAAQPLSEGMTVRVGDIVVTDASAKAKILLADDSVLAIGPRSRVVIDEFALGESRTVRLNVLAGRFKLAVAKFFAGSTDCQVRTPTAVAGVRGTVLWGDTDMDTICALDGQIEVHAATSQVAVAVTAGRCVSQMASGTMVPLQPSAAEIAAYLKAVTVD